MLNLSEQSTKLCRECKVERPENEFYKNGFKRKKKTGHALRNECKRCCNEIHARYVVKNKQAINARRKEKYYKNKTPAIECNLKRYYGLTLESYNQMFNEQHGCCKICGIHQRFFERRFDVDHCHTTKKIRGLLCIKCNRGLGLFQDSKEILKKALDYLEG